ncbi:MAG TPA: HEAT repeat domain-containing protein, partial [Thermoanaerobaculia bacterium]
MLETLGGILVKGALGEAAGSVRRKLSGDPAQAALRKAVSEALADALQQSGLSPETVDHAKSFFRDLFGMEAVQVELALLLDPRPDVTLNLHRLAEELEEGGLDCATLPGFDLERFLGAFAQAFYSAAGKQAALRDLLDLKLLGTMVDRLGTIARSTDRVADGVERLNENVEGLRRELPEFVAGRMSEAALLASVYTLGSAGLIPAFDGLRLLQQTVNTAGYDVEVDREGRLRIAGQPSEERALPPARLGALERVAAELRRAVAAQQPSAADLDALAERYRLHVVRWFQHLSFQGMTPSARAIVLPLEEVYVELRAVAEVPEAADSFSVDERRLLLEVDERDPKAKDELLRQLDALRRERWGRSIPERKSIAAALYQRDQRAFVILGDPGSGKSTLLHFLALVHARGTETAARRLEIDAAEADRLPIFVPLAAFDDMLRETPGLTLLEFLPRYYDRRRGLPGLGPLFLRALETGRALVLLDGLDEVLNAGTRSYVAQQAGALIGEWSPRGVRFAVSSRFVGYREAPVPGSLPTLSVLDFGEQEIEVFVHRWSHAYETWAAAGEATPEALRKARDLERDVLDDVRSNDSVRRLAANPLMLTLLALLRRQVGRLPHRRVQLYEAYVSTMLDNWLAARSQGAREKSVVALDRHQAENILIPMALWLQQEKPSGTAGGAELESALTAICLKEKGLARESATLPQLREAEDNARRFLREMREMTGLLVARGHDAFGFLHLTFQEYFAGRGLALMGAEERWSSLQPHLHDPRWREPILLCAGRLGVVENRRKEVTDFVRRILSSPDPTEPDLHRNLLLALAIACDDVNLDPGALQELIETAVRCLPTRVYVFAGLVLGFLARLIADGAAGASLERYLAPVWESGDSSLEAVAVQSLGRFAGKPEIRALLLEKLTRESWLVRRAAVQALAGFASDPQVRSALLARLEDRESAIRDAAVRALAGLLPEDRQILEQMVELLGDGSIGAPARVLAGIVRDVELRALLIERFHSGSLIYRRNMLIALSDTSVDDADLRSLIIAGLSDEDVRVRRSAILAMKPRLLEDAEARSFILKKLGNKNVPYLRGVSFIALASQLGALPEIDSVVLSGLEDEDPEIRYAAVQALAPRAGSDEAIWQAVARLVEDPAMYVRQAAIRALAPLLHMADIRNTLFPQATNVAWQVRLSVAEALGQTSGAPASLRVLMEIRDNTDAPEAVAFINGCLKPLSTVPGGRDFIVSCLKQPVLIVAAIKSLSGLATVDVQVRGELLARLGDGNSSVRSATVSALSELLGSDAEVRGALLARLEDDDPSVRSSTVLALSVLLSTDAEVRGALLARLEDDEPLVISSAVSALSVLLSTESEIRGALLARLEDDDPSVRSSAVSALSVLLGTDVEIRGALLARLQDEKPSVRSSAVLALSKTLGTDAEVRGVLLARLGDDSFSVRSAVVSVLSVLFSKDDEAC